MSFPSKHVDFTYLFWVCLPEGISYLDFFPRLGELRDAGFHMQAGCGRSLGGARFFFAFEFDVFYAKHDAISTYFYIDIVRIGLNVFLFSMLLTSLELTTIFTLLWSLPFRQEDFDFFYLPPIPWSSRKFNQQIWGIKQHI